VANDLPATNERKRDYALHKRRLKNGGFLTDGLKTQFFRLAGFFSGLIFDRRRMASSKSMSSFKPIIFFRAFDFNGQKHNKFEIAKQFNFQFISSPNPYGQTKNDLWFLWIGRLGKNRVARN
jgi:hypothetical protein